jgi:SNF2 family DNA or RNA helicase
LTLVSEVLFDYQVEAAKRINESRRILLADQPGLGKTLEVLGALELDGALDRPCNILVLTPIVNAQTTWIDSLERFIAPRYPINIVDASKGSAAKKSKAFEQSKVYGPTFVIANHNAIDLTKSGVRVPELIQEVYDAVIVDESHLVLPIAGNSLTNFQKGLGKVVMRPNTMRVAISGTPDRGKLENRYGTWKFLFTELMPHNKWAWLEQNFWVIEQQVSRTRTVKVPTTLKDSDEWLKRDRAWMIRRTKNEVLTQLPPKRYVDVLLPMPDPQKARYFDVQMRYEEALRERDASGIDKAEAMTAAIRFRQNATCMWDPTLTPPEPIVGGHSAKLEWLIEWLSERSFIEQDAMSENSSVVIVSQFSKILEWLQKELQNVGISSAVLDGRTGSQQRIDIQHKFQQGELRIVLLSGTMGVGINLDRADDLIMLDSPYDPDRIEQIEDRVHRASNMHNVTIWNLLAKDTIDEAIAEKVSKRYKVTRELLDGSRGIDFARKILAQVMERTSE